MVRTVSTITCQNCGAEMKIEIGVEDGVVVSKRQLVRNVWITMRDPSQTRHTCFECCFNVDEKEQE